MNKKIEYNINGFRSNILYKMTTNSFNRCIEDFVYTYNSNRSLVTDKFGETYINNLIQIKLPKIIRTSAWHKEKYELDMWHVYIIGNWKQTDIFKLQQNSLNSFSWKTDWDQEYATNYNQNAYMGEY